MLMLQMDIRASIPMAEITGPAYSYAYPMPPFTPRWRIIESTTSLAYTPRASFPVTEILRTLGFVTDNVCVANTSRTCVVPIPKAIDPNAPWVDVCESPQAITMPGWVNPNSGPMTCTMP